MVICRVEKWITDNDGFAVSSEFDELYFLLRNGRKLQWFDKDLKKVEPVVCEKLRILHRVLNNEMNDTIDYDGFSLDFIFHEDNVFPYDVHSKIDYSKVLLEC